MIVADPREVRSEDVLYQLDFQGSSDMRWRFTVVTSWRRVLRVMIFFFVVWSLFVLNPVLAQVQAPISVLALQQQRNLAMDWHAQAVARIDELTEEIRKLQGRIQELEKKTPKEERE